MIDLRLFSQNLVGKEFTPKRSGIAQNGFVLMKSRKYVIDKVYPYFVKAHSVCDNGYLIIECFSVGDLVENGWISGRAR